MTNEQIKEIVARAEDEHEYLKDRVHDLYDENVKLKEEYIMLQNASDEVEEEKDREIERLNNIINETIEYIKAVGVIPKNIDIFVLLDILKGSDKE